MLELKTCLMPVGDCEKHDSVCPKAVSQYQKDLQEEPHMALWLSPSGSCWGD